MTEDEFRWAEALAIYRMHGDQAVLWVADRVESLARAGDEAGVTRFRQIEVKLNQLTRPEATGQGRPS